MSKRQRIADLERTLEDLGNTAERLQRDAKRGRLVILYAKAGEHLVPLYDELVRAANVSVDHDYVDASSWNGDTKTYLVGPSTVTIRVTR